MSGPTTFGVFVVTGPGGHPWYGIGETGRECPGYGKVHALCGPVGGEYEEESIREAFLFAAAPDMYEAIKEYLEWGPMTGSDRDLHAAAFRAAITKAEPPK